MKNKAAEQGEQKKCTCVVFGQFRWNEKNGTSDYYDPKCPQHGNAFKSQNIGDHAGCSYPKCFTGSLDYQECVCFPEKIKQPSGEEGEKEETGSVKLRGESASAGHRDSEDSKTWFKIKALGNAIVPQIAYEIFKAINKAT